VGHHVQGAVDGLHFGAGPQEPPGPVQFRHVDAVTFVPDLSCHCPTFVRQRDVH
jgi:hypothetical protein